MHDKDKLKKDTIQLVADQIYDKMTRLFNDKRKRSGVKGGANIEEPIRNYDCFDLDDNRNLTFTYKNKVANFWNIIEGLMTPSKIRELDVNRLRLMGFRNITDEET